MFTVEVTAHSADGATEVRAHYWPAATVAAYLRDMSQSHHVEWSQSGCRVWIEATDPHVAGMPGANPGVIAADVAEWEEDISRYGIE